MIFAVIHVKSFVRMATLVLASTVSIPNLWSIPNHLTKVQKGLRSA
jgi:hypothetical protein